MSSPEIPKLIRYWTSKSTESLLELRGTSIKQLPLDERSQQIHAPLADSLIVYIPIDGDQEIPEVTDGSPKQ